MLYPFQPLGVALNLLFISGNYFHVRAALLSTSVILQVGGQEKGKKQNRADIFLTLQPAEEPGSLKKKKKKEHITTQKPGGTRHDLVTRTEKMWVRETLCLKNKSWNLWWPLSSLCLFIYPDIVVRRPVSHRQSCWFGFVSKTTSKSARLRWMW